MMFAHEIANLFFSVKHNVFYLHNISILFICILSVCLKAATHDCDCEFWDVI